GFRIRVRTRLRSVHRAPVRARLSVVVAPFPAGERMELNRLIPPPPRLELRLQGGVFVPLSHDAWDALPVAPAVGVQLHVTNWPSARLPSYSAPPCWEHGRHRDLGPTLAAAARPRAGGWAPCSSGTSRLLILGSWRLHLARRVRRHARNAVPHRVAA